MKNKLNLIILAILGLFVGCLRPVFGVLSSIRMSFFLGCMIFFIKGFKNFATTQHKGLISYISMLYSNLKTFINAQAHEYECIVWYKKPKYWLLLVLLILEICPRLYYWYPGIKAILLQCIYCIPILLGIIIGYVYPFVFLLLVYGVYHVLRTIMWFSWNYNIFDTMSWIWYLLSIITLITVCAIIEIKRNKKSSFWKRFFKEFMIGILCVGYWIGTFYVKDKIEANIARKNFIPDCIKYNKRPDIDNKDLEKFCIYRYNRVYENSK